jgi:ketosteroid isomerase-like protein
MNSTSYKSYNLIITIMKNLLLILVSILLSMGVSAQTKVDVEKEKAAIKKVITEATEAFRIRDFDKIATTYVHDETLIKTGAALGGFQVNNGWGVVSENYKTMFKNNPEPVPGKFEKVNFRIKVYDDVAWAVHDEIVHRENGDTFKSVITHFLEKHDDKWKVAYMANIRSSSWDVAEEVSNTN